MKPQIHWRHRAACQGKDPDMFFGEPDADHAGRPKADWQAKLNEGKRVCFSCPVRTTCLNYALEHRIMWGLWGGVSQNDRRKLIRERNRVSA